MMLSLILALVCSFVGSLFLFGGMMLTVVSASSSPRICFSY